MKCEEILKLLGRNEVGSALGAVLFVIVISWITHLFSGSWTETLVALCAASLFSMLLIGLNTLPSKPDDAFDVPPWLMRLVFVVGICCVLVVVLAYAQHQCMTELAAAGAGTAASLGVGGILGFVFGIPRSLQSNSSATKTDEGSAKYSPNTNLERISDWLTTIIIGITLTQFRDIQAAFDRVAGEFATALGTHPNRFFAGSIIAFFSVAGFLVAYLWTRLRLSRDFQDADNPIRQEPEFDEGRMNAYLFRDQPEGFTKVLEIASEYAKRFKTPPNGRIWSYIACAYGQKHSYLRRQSGWKLGDPESPDMQAARKAAVDAVQQAILGDYGTYSLLKGLWKPDVSDPFADADLASLDPDEDLERIFDRYKPG